jgi:citronellyl-CoA dehydrogenase
VGAEGMGFIYQMEQFQYERLFAAIKGYAAAQKAINLTIDYTRERQAFGKSILDNQYVGYRLAEMQAETDALRALAWAGVETIVHGGDATRIATSAKFKAGRLLREVSDGCLQFWGGMGYVHDSPISRIWRDTRLSSIGGGADEVMLQIMTKFMGTYSSKG